MWMHERKLAAREPTVKAKRIRDASTVRSMENLTCKNSTQFVTSSRGVDCHSPAGEMDNKTGHWV
jgi:hypothetical protein